MASDISSILKSYIAAMEKNEANLAELTRNLRGWVVENGEAVKEKIIHQIDDSAVRMGFVKASELDVLLERITELENRLPLSKDKSPKAKTGSKKVSAKTGSKKVSGKKNSSIQKARE